MLSETYTNAFVGLSHWILTGQNSLAVLNATTTPQRSTLNFLKNHLVAGSKKPLHSVQVLLRSDLGPPPQFQLQLHGRSGNKELDKFGKRRSVSPNKLKKGPAPSKKCVAFTKCSPTSKVTASSSFKVISR